jgi:DNA-binding NarL/FixJ family response regulator
MLQKYGIGWIDRIAWRVGRGRTWEYVMVQNKNYESRISVFLADDHAMVREALASLVCKDEAFEVVGQCGDGLEVLREIYELQPDVAVLDIQMPGLNGLDVCREVARKVSKTRVLILSMHDSEQFIRRAFEYGAKGYLLKEAASDRLAEAIHTVARDEPYIGPGIDGSLLKNTSSAMHDPYEKLTTRERQVLQLIAEGKTNKMVAQELGLSVKTIDTHRMRLMRKLNIHDQTTLVKFAVGRGIIHIQ